MKLWHALAAITLVVFTAATCMAEMPGMSIKGSVSGDIYFNKGSHDLTDVARKTLAEVADWVRKNKNSTVMLAGYDDQRTTQEESIEMGKQRDSAVADYLVSLGVPRDSISSISFGNTKLAATGEGEEVWSKNRRVRYLVVAPPSGEKMEGPPSGV